MPGRQPQASISQALPERLRGVSSRVFTRLRSSVSLTVAVSGTRTSRPQYEAVRSLPGRPSTRIRPSLARWPEVSTSVTSSRVPLVLGGTITRSARRSAPASERGGPGCIRTGAPGSVQRIASASRPGSGETSHPAKCGDAPAVPGGRQARVASWSTWAQRVPPLTVAEVSGRKAAVRRAPTAWVSTRAGSAEGARRSEPSRRGRTRSSPATNRRAAAAM
ncbi:hypothetical protein SALBM135S_09178 [Streptomyces alboniger]